MTHPAYLHAYLNIHTYKVRNYRNKDVAAAKLVLLLNNVANCQGASEYCTAVTAASLDILQPAFCNS